MSITRFDGRSMTGPSTSDPPETPVTPLALHRDPAGAPKASPGRSPWQVRLLRFALVAGGLGVVAGLGIAGKERLPAALRAVEAAGPWAPLLFVLAYAAATVLGVPGSILTLGAGALFGLFQGIFWASIGSTLGATAAFLLTRYTAGSWIRRKLPDHAVVERLDRAVARAGWKIVLLTRLSPVLPFTLLNYVYGLTPVKTSQYIWGSWIGMLPGTAMYVYLGSTARALAGARERTPAEWILYGLGAVATLCATLWITRVARAALQQQQEGLQP